MLEYTSLLSMEWGFFVFANCYLESFQTRWKMYLMKVRKGQLIMIMTMWEYISPLITSVLISIINLVILVYPNTAIALLASMVKGVSCMLLIMHCAMIICMLCCYWLSILLCSTVSCSIGVHTNSSLRNCIQTLINYLSMYFLYAHYYHNYLCDYIWYVSCSLPKIWLHCIV